MQANFRHTIPTEKYEVTDYLREMQNKFNGHRSLDWEDLADYANYLKYFGESLAKS